MPVFVKVCAFVHAKVPKCVREKDTAMAWGCCTAHTHVTRAVFSMLGPHTLTTQLGIKPFPHHLAVVQKRRGPMILADRRVKSQQEVDRMAELRELWRTSFQDSSINTASAAGGGQDCGVLDPEW